MLATQFVPFLKLWDAINDPARRYNTPRTASPGLLLLAHGTQNLVQRMLLTLRLFLAY